MVAQRVSEGSYGWVKLLAEGIQLLEMEVREQELPEAVVPLLPRSGASEWSQRLLAVKGAVSSHPHVHLGMFHGHES